MRIFEGFLVLFLSSILWLLPVSRAIYDYRTDIREDRFTVVTGPGETVESVVLLKPIYGDDTGTVSISSNVTADSPMVGSYNPDTRQLTVSGLAENESHLLAVSYDVSALIGHTAVSMFLNWLPYIWYLLLFIFPVATIYVIVRRRT